MIDEEKVGNRESNIEKKIDDEFEIKRSRISKIYSLIGHSKKENESKSKRFVTLEEIQKLNSDFKLNKIDQENEKIYQEKYREEFIEALISNNDNKFREELNNEHNEFSELFSEDETYSDNDISSKDEKNDTLELIYSIDKKKRIPEIKHDEFDYPDIIKNFYKEVDEIRKLKQHEVDHIRITNNGIHIKRIKNMNEKDNFQKSIKPILNFSQCGLPLPIHNYLKKKNIVKPFPIQMQSIPILMSGYDLIGIAETGSGKTLAYILPLIRHIIVQLNNNENLYKKFNYIKSLIIVPTRELALQVYKQTTQIANLVNLNTNIICGGLGISQQLNKIRSGTDIIVGTPGRIIDIITLLYKKTYLFQYISFIVIDEGDRLFDMGFAPQLLSIISIIRPDRQIAIFSATFPNVIEQFTNRILRNPIQVIVGKKGQMNHNVKQYIELFQNENEQFLRLLQLLGEWSEFGLIVIFCNKQTDVDELFAKLIPFGYNCLTLHSGQDHYDRHSNLTTFSKTNVNSNPPPPSGQNILIATSIFSRGLHVDNILLVINYGAPHHIEDYIHRIGRTGRAGNFGTSFTLLLPNELLQSSDLIDLAIKHSSNENDTENTIIIQPEIIQQYNEILRSNINNTSSNSLSSQNIKKRIRNFGFGGKGFKFSKDEKNSLQLLKDDTKKALGLIPDNITEEQIFVNDIFENDLNIYQNNNDLYSNSLINNSNSTNTNSEAEKAFQQAMNAAKLIYSNSNNIVSNSTEFSNNLPSNLHQVVNGRVIGIFEINDYPTHIRQKIVHKDIIKSINDNCGVTCQVKGIYIPPNSSGLSNTTNSVHISDKKKLYIEINGPNYPKVQKAIHELNLIISSIKYQSNVKPSYTSGKYTLSNLLKK